jgi:nucleoside ABC transporter membrane protein
MSTASVPLPNWITYGLMPFLNLVVAFLISGAVVWFIGESPLDAVTLLLQGALGNGEGIGFTLYYATNFIFTGCRWQSLTTPACSTSARKVRPMSAASARHSPRSPSTITCPGT